MTTSTYSTFIGMLIECFGDLMCWSNPLGIKKKSTRTQRCVVLGHWLFIGGCWYVSHAWKIGWWASLLGWTHSPSPILAYMVFKFANKIQKMTRDFLDQVWWGAGRLVAAMVQSGFVGTHTLGNWYFPDHVFNWKLSVPACEVINNTVEKRV